MSKLEERDARIERVVTSPLEEALDIRSIETCIRCEKTMDVLDCVSKVINQRNYAS